jgi:hypothetical protein
MDIANGTHWDSRQQWRLWKAAPLICIILLLSSLLPFTNAIAAPPSDDPEPGEIRLGMQDEGGQVELKEGQVLVIRLESNPSTGYMWEVEEADERILRQTGKIEFENQRISLANPMQERFMRPISPT